MEEGMTVSAATLRNGNQEVGMQQIVEKNPFLKLDTSMVLGFLKSTGSHDPDVLHAQKASLLSAAKFPKVVGIYLMVVGGLMTLMIVLFFIGIPLMGLGWWLRGRGNQNVKVVEEAYAEYVAAVA
jgi:hypothetical protein